MKKGSMRLSMEIKSIIVIVLILTFIFAFDDGKPSLILKDWFLKFFYVLILVVLTVLFNSFGYKLMAKYLGTEVEIRVWNSEKFEGRFSLSKLHKYIFSPVLGVLIMLFSNGKIFFTAVSTFDIKNYNMFGRKFPKLTEFNVGLIATFGLFFNLILMILFKALSIDKGVFINSWFIAWSLLPFSNLPGAKIFIASRSLYVFSLIFFIANILLIPSLPLLYAILSSFVLSSLLAIAYFYFLEYLKA